MRIRTVVSCSMAAAIGLGVSFSAFGAGSVTVNSTGDDISNDSVCTLREALNVANSGASANGCVLSGSGSPTTIAFDLGGSGVQTIAVASQLPEINVPIVLDGLTEPGADCSQWPPTLRVEINSPSNGAYNGLTLNTGAGGSVVRGLVINGFNNNQGSAFNFNAAINIHVADGIYVECNFLGTDASGTVASANLRAVDINGGSNNVIGSDGTPKTYVSRNLLSGNSYGQVDTRGDALSGNRISGNFIGTDVTGTAAIGGGFGVSIGSNPGPASGNFIGWDGNGDPVLMRNIMSGFGGSQNAAIDMEVGAIGNQVAGNYIGTDVTGMQAIGNGTGVQLGSNASVYHNIIGNDGTQDAASARNVISASTYSGVAINGANGTHDNAVIGNYIGLNAAGTATLPNGLAGVQMAYATANTLVARNWFQGNTRAIYFFASGSFGGGSTASFINNAASTIAGLPALDSRDNCLLDSTGISIVAQGANVPSPNQFANNWWGASTGPNTSGAASADGSIGATPFLTAPATVCSDVIFSDGFESN